MVPDDMSEIHRLLNCSYVDVEPGRYLPAFRKERSKCLEMLGRESPGEKLSVGLREPRDIAQRLIAERFPDGVIMDRGAPVFMTENFLGTLLMDLADGKPLDPWKQKFVNTLQKRFEVNHRIFTRYDANVRKQGEEYRAISVYAIMACTWFLVSQSTGHLSLANTAIKIDDLMLKSGWIPKEAERKLVFWALELEDWVLQQLDET